MNQNDLLSFFYYKDGDLYRFSDSFCRPAGWTTTNNGKPYRKVNFQGKTLYVHRVIYCMHTGDWPRVIDHVNGISNDNRIENLRAADQSKNTANSKLSKANTSGAKGVTWRKDTKKWAAQIMVGGKHISLGCYQDIESAKQAYADGSKKYFVEFARPEQRVGQQSRPRSGGSVMYPKLSKTANSYLLSNK